MMQSAFRVVLRYRSAPALLLAVGVMIPGLLRAQGQSTVHLVSAPTGTTTQTNPEIQVDAPGKTAYRYSLNGGPYSPELPIATPIRLTGHVEVGGLPFAAGSSALIDFLKLRSTDPAFTTFLDRITFDGLGSELHVAYTLNKMRVAVAPQNVLNLQGAGVADLDVTLHEKVPSGPLYELSALSIAGGLLLQRPGTANARSFLLQLSGTAHEVGITPRVNNGQTQITVNGLPTAAGQTIVVPAPADGHTISIETSAPDGSVTTYSIEVSRNDTLQAAEYRAHYLRALQPASAYVSIRNVGTSLVEYNLKFNEKFGLTTQEIVQEILDLTPEFPGEGIQRKVWRYIRDNRYHKDPLTTAHWNHSPGLFFSSIGFGYCDDSASLFRHLMIALGYQARVWSLNGHVVPEALVNGRWEMWDPDLQVYYFNRDGMIAGVEELAADPDLILNPATRIPGAHSAAYDAMYADMYSSPSDNSVNSWYDLLPDVGDSSMTFAIPAGGTFEFPDVYDAPLSSILATRVPAYANARLIVPEGFSGTVKMPLVIHSIGWSNMPTLRVITKDAQGNWDQQPTAATWVVDAEAPFTMATQPSGVFNAIEPITLTTSEPATIYFTTDGSTPSESAAVYTTPIVLPSPGPLRFFAVDQMGNRERVRTYGGQAPGGVQLQLTGVTAAAATFSASAFGGSGSYEYMFELRDSLGNSSIVQFYGSSNVWTLNKPSVPPGSYVVRVCVRNSETMVVCNAAASVGIVVQTNAAPLLVHPGDQVDNTDLRSYRETILTDQPVGYWRLDEEIGNAANDWAGDNIGSRFGTVSPVQPGSLADGTPAAAFDGATGHVLVPNSPSLELSGDLTIELWANVSLAARQTLISKHSMREFELTLETNGALNLYHGNGATAGNVRSTNGVVSANVWQHLVVTRSAATKTVSFYVNGQPAGAATYTVDPAAGTGPVWIGRNPSGSQHVNGRLDEVALYPTVLSATQVARHYVMRLANGGDVPVELPLVATDPNGDALTYAAEGLPPGLTLNASTGLISGSLSQASAGIYQVVATVSDGLLTHSQPFLWSVTHVNRAPQLITPAAQMHAENVPVAVPVLASDPDGDPLTFSASGLPSPLVIDPATGIISGVLSFESAGTYSVTVGVADGQLSATGTFTWIVANTNRAPVLVNPGPQTHYARSAYSATVMRDHPAAYWRLGETSGPTAAHDSLGSHSGALAGSIALNQPGALADGDRAMLFDGNSYIQVPAAAGLALAGDLTIELWVNVSLAARQTVISKDYLREFELTIETNGELNFYQGNGSISGNVRSTSGAVKPHVWQHVVVTRTAATNTIAFYVNSAAKGGGSLAVAAAPGSAPVSIGRSNSGVRHVAGRLDEVAIYPQALTALQVAAHYALANDASSPTHVALQLQAVDPDGDVLTFGATGLPPGISIDAATGLISGQATPEGAGTSHVTATVTDGALSGSQSFTWTVERVNVPPIIDDPGNQTTAEGSPISFVVSARDPDGDALAYTATGLPASLSLDAATGAITGTPSFTSAGQYAVTLTVSDGHLSASRTITWIVTNTNRPPVLLNPGPQTHYARGEYAAAVIRDQPAAYWRLGETSGPTAHDSLGPHAGTLVGSIALNQPGALADGDRAMLFDGNSYIQVPGAAGLALAGDLTIELWVNVSLASRQTVISKDFLREFELTLETNGELNFYQGNGSISGNVRSMSGAVKPHVWQHVVVTRTAATNTIAFYVNGDARGTGSLAVAAAPGTAPISIGRAHSGARSVTGRLDEIAIYPRALTASQTGAHYRMSTPAVGDEITLQLSAADPDGDPLVYSAMGLPPGLAVHPQTGLISGNVGFEGVGTYEVTVTAADPMAAAASRTFSWTVE